MRCDDGEMPNMSDILTIKGGCASFVFVNSYIALVINTMASNSVSAVPPVSVCIVCCYLISYFVQTPADFDSWPAEQKAFYQKYKRLPKQNELLMRKVP